MEQNRKRVPNNIARGLFALLICYLIWGFQPLYWNIGPEADTYFVMAMRVIFAAFTCLVILAVQKKLGALAEVFRTPSLLKKELAASVFLFIDWIVYLVAVKNGRVLDCALGYYIMPLVVFLFGCLVFHERPKPFHFVSLALVVAGILFSVRGVSGFPRVTVILSIAFAVYSAVKKGQTVDSVVSTTAEILIMVPFALAWLLFSETGRAGLAAADARTLVYFIGAGAVTGLPMVFFAIGVNRLPLITTGILTYLSPTLGTVCGLLLGEPLGGEKLVTFLFIWAGIAVFAFFTVAEQRRAEARAKRGGTAPPV